MAATDSELKKLHKQIREEGINKKSYSSNESENSSDSDSDKDLLLKFIPRKRNRENHGGFDTIGYSFQLSIKISKLRSELARVEERLRYLQLEHNNCEISLELETDKNKLVNQKYKDLSAEHNKLLSTSLIVQVLLFISVIFNFHSFF
jgi:hypothetical protein